MLDDDRCRRKFEQWVIHYPASIERDANGSYINFTTAISWGAWQIAWMEAKSNP